jgi:hypothetical protein
MSRSPKGLFGMSAFFRFDFGPAFFTFIFLSFLIRFYIRIIFVPISSFT